MTYGKLAPERGLEPLTRRLTAGCSTIELLWNPEGSKVIYTPCHGQIDFPKIYVILWLSYDTGNLTGFEAVTSLNAILEFFAAIKS